MVTAILSLPLSTATIVPVKEMMWFGGRAGPWARDGRPPVPTSSTNTSPTIAVIVNVFFMIGSFLLVAVCGLVIRSLRYRRGMVKTTLPSFLTGYLLTKYMA
jgi:hypothetical protein